MKFKYIIIQLLLSGIFFISCNKEKIENELALLENYLEENGYEDKVPEASGLYCIKTGFSTPATLTSDFPSEGDTIITVHKGYLLSDPNVVFDEKDFINPGKYIYLEDPVISGWEEAMSLLKKDMSALLIIPSDLAYKGKQIGIIPPYSTLIFEVHILDIK